MAREPFVSPLHLYPSLLLAGFCFYCYYKAVNTDPGVITKENVKHYMDKYPHFDEVVFQRDNTCPTCKIKKPPRSKHSSITNNCVARFDHYCIWIKGDVGEKNYKYFLGFIGGHALLTFYGCYFGLNVLIGIVTREGLWGAKFRSMETGEVFTAGYLTIFQVHSHNSVLTQPLPHLRIPGDPMLGHVPLAYPLLHLPHAPGECGLHYQRKG